MHMIENCSIFVVIGTLALLASGCGNGGGKKAQNAATLHAALNAELAVRESGLAERLAALSPDAVTNAVEQVRATVCLCEKTAEGIPPDKSDSRSVVVESLLLFRNGTEKLAKEIADASLAAKTARTQASKYNEIVRNVFGNEQSRFEEIGLSGNLEQFLASMPETFRETKRLLSGWRSLRLEKMEKSEFATFQTFHAAAVERCNAWDKWITQAETVKRELLDRILPFVTEASSNLSTQVEIAKREDGRADEALRHLREIPVDPALVHTARNTALASWNGVVGEVVKAMEQWTIDDTTFATIARNRAANCLKRANSLDADVKSFVAAHGDFLPRQQRTNVATTVKNAKEAHGKGETVAIEYDTAVSNLRKDWVQIETAIPEVRNAAQTIRSGEGIREEDLAAAITKIEQFRKRIETFRFVERCFDLYVMRESTLAALTSAEKALEETERNLASAKSKALSDEKKAKWEDEKKKIKDSLLKVKASIEDPLRPGYTRPEGEANSLRRTVERLLARIDSVPEQELRSAAEKAQSDLGRLERQTKWTIGTRHPTLPHIFADIEKDGAQVWNSDPGYRFNVYGENSDLSVRWDPGRRHPDHSHISAGQTEGSWVPDPGYKARWDGDLDPVWTKGERHPRWPHVYAGEDERKWATDPGYEWASSNDSDFSVRWKPGVRHPTYEGLESAQQEGRWNTLPGWAFVNPVTSDLRTRWMPGSRYLGKPHIHASDEKWKWRADDGYDFVEYNSSNLSVRWMPGTRHSLYRGVVAAQQEGYWNTREGWSFVNPGTSDLKAKWNPGTRRSGWPHVFASDKEDVWAPDAGYTWVNPDNNGDFSVKWTPGWISSDGQQRAKDREGHFETKHDCASCENGWKIKWHRCGTCNGSGKHLFGTCHGCNGIGKTIVSRTICTNCNGTGWKWR